MRQNLAQHGIEKLRSSARAQRDGGYLLLAILLMMAFMVITFAYVVGPRMVQQMKRDREEEMIHRGTEYMRAIKKFYKKNGRYPSSLDDLDKGQVRYLRQRYKDPLTKDGKWKLLSYADIQSVLNTSSGPGVSAASLASAGGTLTPGGAVVPGAGGSSGFGAAQQQQLQQSQQAGSITSGFVTNSDQGSNQEAVPTSGAQSGSGGSTSGFGNSQSGFGSSSASGFGSNQPGAATGAQGSSPLTSATGGQALTGTIVGVASLSKDPTIRIYNKKKTYDQWLFFYNPMMDQTKVLLRGPYQPSTTGNTNIGTPASQLNGQNGTTNQQNGFGQQGGFGQQNSGFGQQNTPQAAQPGGSFSQQNQQQ
jgi:hypothetical protein